MEENNLEQNIDPTTSTSLIDQITKVPDLKPKPKIKNPKKIAAGKKLAEYNRKAKQKAAQVNDVNEEENNNNDSSFFPANSLTSIIALFGLGLTALDLFLRYKGQQNISKKVDESDNNNQEPDEKEYEDVSKIKVLDSKSFGGME